MKNITVAGAQIPVVGMIDINEEFISEAIEYAARNGADILLTPEGSLSGYHNQFDIDLLEKALKSIVSKASSSGIGLALGTCYRELEDGLPHNEIRFYDKKGNFLGSHSKILRTTGEREQFAPSPLKTFQFEDITIGGLICNDMWANPECTPEPDPHLSQQLAEKGVKIIFHAVNGGRSADPYMPTIRMYHESNLLMRARAGKIWIVTVDNSFPENIPCSAPSGVIDPKGTWKIKAPNQDIQYFHFTISLDD